MTLKEIWLFDIEILPGSLSLEWGCFPFVLMIRKWECTVIWEHTSVVFVTEF